MTLREKLLAMRDVDLRVRREGSDMDAWVRRVGRRS